MTETRALGVHLATKRVHLASYGVIRSPIDGNGISGGNSESLKRMHMTETRALGVHLATKQVHLASYGVIRTPIEGKRPLFNSIELVGYRGEHKSKLTHIRTPPQSGNI